MLKKFILFFGSDKVLLPRMTRYAKRHKSFLNFYLNGLSALGGFAYASRPCHWSIRGIRVLSFIVILCFVQCTHHVKPSPVLNRISIIYINNWSFDNAAKIAALIKNELKLAPIVVLTNGKIFSESPITNLNKGYAELEILNASQIDAILLTPHFLRWGIQHSKELIKKSNFFCLAANIKDKSSNQPLGQEYLIKTLGKVQVVILGISFDSLNYYFQNKNLDFHNPAFTVFKLLPQLKTRSDFQFILTQTQDSLDLPVDFIFGAPIKDKVQLLPLIEPGIYKLEIGYDNLKNIIELKRATISIDTLPDDSIVKAITTQYQAKTDSVLSIKYANIKNTNFNDWAIKTILTETKAQGFLSDQPLVDKNFTTKDFTMTDLYKGLDEKTNLPILTINGKELRKFRKSINPPLKEILDNKDYPILSTINFIEHHPELKFDSIAFTNLAVWEILSNNLKK
jgi:hypothetical protein